MQTPIGKISRAEVGARIFEKRIERHITMDELAKLISVSSKSKVDEWERGRLLPDKNTLMRIAYVLHTSFDYLAFGNKDSFKLSKVKSVEDANPAKYKTDLSQVFARNLRVMMAERKIRNSQMYERTGIARSTLFSIEEGKTKMIRFDTVEKISKFLGIEPYLLFQEHRI
ncbi:TetR family transcriptional regulator [Secundilactobacillus pentosiphilus]|uniref:TetR family transcriptional regulator n=1 Tax=Secundilactobacillus pentosiphilus TaxID=1714682 RepID=A0A1Z5IVE3_9LACO|nr:helix-turn-helix transcriptional regulator [Secundilactobacillus pentosiphilus]GAX05411.1 TetR family transcriptional regulator [Secundilactobacillus pentosiphilus]